MASVSKACPTGICSQSASSLPGCVHYEAFRHTNDAMFYTDRNGVILEVNEAFARVYGYAAEEAVGRTPRLLKSSRSTPELYRLMWSGILDPRKGGWRGEIINRTKAGAEIPVLLTITAVRDPSGEIVGYVSNALDLSEQMSLQARVAHSEALANLGEMAAVVAHEIRNPLGSIVMAAQQISGARLAREDRETVLQVLRDESQRLNEVLTNFLSYARPREIRLERSDFNALVGEVCRMIRANPDLLGEVELRLTMDRRIEPFPMDPGQIRQVVWNIALNAIQAMEGRGELVVDTGLDGDRAFVRIKDTGPGFPGTELARIFKPFHTTKRQGTGLGLAIADRIVKAHGGRIDARSLPGKGALFTVLLPAMQG